MKEINLAEGSILQKLLAFSLPMILGNLMQQVYNLVDTLVVGNCIGADALASVGSAYTLMVFITSILIGLCMGSGAFFSLDFGAQDEKQLQEDIFLSFWFILAVAAALYAILYPGMDAILRLLQTPGELMAMTREYVAVVFLGNGFVFLYNFFSYLLRSVGNSVVPLVFLAIASVLNVILDLWFVAGLSMGVAGAAWATVIAQAVSGVGILIYTMAKLPYLRLFGKWNWGRMKEIIWNDVATGIQQSVMNFGILMIQGLVNSFGTVVMAAFAAAVKIDSFAYMPVQDFGNAFSTFAAQNYGAGAYDRIRQGIRKALLCITVFCLVISGAVFLFAEQLMLIFVKPEETAVIAEGVRVPAGRGGLLYRYRHPLHALRPLQSHQKAGHVPGAYVHLPGDQGPSGLCHGRNSGSYRYLGGYPHRLVSGGYDRVFLLPVPLPQPTFCGSAKREKKCLGKALPFPGPCDKIF